MHFQVPAPSAFWRKLAFKLCVNVNDYPRLNRPSYQASLLLPSSLNLSNIIACSHLPDVTRSRNIRYFDVILLKNVGDSDDSVRFCRLHCSSFPSSHSGIPQILCNQTPVRQRQVGPLLAQVLLFFSPTYDIGFPGWPDPNLDSVPVFGGSVRLRGLAPAPFFISGGSLVVGRYGSLNSRECVVEVVPLGGPRLDQALSSLPAT
jgi:hypothetical protein